ncbi:hypothetical protein DMUE_3890 [Dictyocoela muelleri]|nr:hypothetical protein DMUE_3890 [Dictyocoela muelleri]
MENDTKKINNKNKNLNKENLKENFIKNKKHIFKINILETYFRQGYVNLSSNDVENYKNEETKTIRKNSKTLDFEITIEGLTEKLKQKIEIIEDIKRVDMIKWIKDFEVLATMNEWNEKIKFSVANVLI